MEIMASNRSRAHKTRVLLNNGLEALLEHLWEMQLNRLPVKRRTNKLDMVKPEKFTRAVTQLQTLRSRLRNSIRSHSRATICFSNRRKGKQAFSKMPIRTDIHITPALIIPVTRVK
jgi:hypothetical protein